MIDITKLRADAEAAGHEAAGDWTYLDIGEVVSDENHDVTIAQINSECALESDGEVGEHIANFAPPTALALLDELEEQRAVLALHQEIMLNPQMAALPDKLKKHGVDAAQVAQHTQALAVAYFQQVEYLKPLVAEAAALFRTYEGHHINKAGAEPDRLEKAERNAEIAGRLEAALKVVR